MYKNENDYSHIVDSIMAANLKSTRESLGLTQDAFAAQLSISTRSLQRYEQKGRPTPQSVRFQVMMQFGREIAPSVELFEEVELLKAENGVSGSCLDRIGGSRWKRFRAGTRAFRLSNFTPWGQHVLAGRDYLALFLIGCMLGGLAKAWRISSANEIPPSSLVLFFPALMMFASMLPELPLAKAVARVLTRRNPSG